MGQSIRKRFRHCARYGESSAFAQVSYFPYKKTSAPAKRQRKYQVSTPKQRNLNNKRSIRYLEALIHSNFKEGDFHLSLSYDEAHRPRDEKDAKRIFGNFIDRVNYRLKKLGLPNAKWVCVNEQGKNGRIHHHVIISCGLDRDTLESVWKCGFANTKRLQPDSQLGLLKLVHYIAKECKTTDRPKSTRKWDSSQNLIKPWDSVNDNPRMMSKKKYHTMQELPEDCAQMREIIEKDNPGYELISVEKEYREDISGWYFFCRLRLSAPKPRKRKTKTANVKNKNVNIKKKGKERAARSGDTRAKPPPADKGPP